MGRKLDVLDCLLSYVAESLSSTGTFQGVFLEHINQFDHQFFNIPPGEAKFMSPEQKALQVATESLAEGSNLSNIKGSNIGVFVGNFEVGYSQLNHPDEGTIVFGLMSCMSYACCLSMGSEGTNDACGNSMLITHGIEASMSKPFHQWPISKYLSRNYKIAHCMFLLGLFLEIQILLVIG